MHVGRGMPGARVAPHLRPYQAVHREEGLLGRGGDCASAPVRGSEVRQSLRTVRGPDLLEGELGERRPEGVAERGPDERAADPAAEILLLGAAPYGR